MASDRIWGNPKRVRVLLDTNALFMIFEQNIRIEDELQRLLGSFDICIIQQIYDELIFLQQKGTGKQQKLAKTALSFIKRYPLIEGIQKESVDASLLHTAMDLSAIVVTNDVELRKKLMRTGLQTIFLRGKNHLMLE